MVQDNYNYSAQCLDGVIVIEINLNQYEIPERIQVKLLFQTVIMAVHLPVIDVSGRLHAIVTVACVLCYPLQTCFLESPQ